MSSYVDSAFWLFFALAWAFALVTILISWWRVDHGLAEVLAARRDRDEYQNQVDSLHHAIATLSAEWPVIYIGLRKLGLEYISDGKSLMELYRRVVRHHSRYHDIEMIFPEMHLPAELESPEPPPLPAEDANNEIEEEKGGRP